MNIIILILTAIGLSIDSLAVSISYGTIISKNKIITALKISIIFGIFHIAMTLIGYLLGDNIKDYISVFDHWIAFLILTFIGVKMIIDELRTKKTDEKKKYSLKFITILYLALATSIDALAVGLSFSLIDTSIGVFAILVGIIVFIFTMAGILFGAFLSEKIKIKMQVVGGIVLILIGIKIIFEHLLNPITLFFTN